MGDTFKVTTAALNDFIDNKLEPLATDIHDNKDVQQITQWSTASTSPLKAGNGDVATTLQTQFTDFAKRMSDNTDGVQRQTEQLSRNVKDVGEHFHATDENAQWSVQQVQGLLYNLQTDATGSGSGSGATGSGSQSGS